MAKAAMSEASTKKRRALNSSLAGTPLTYRDTMGFTSPEPGPQEYPGHRYHEGPARERTVHENRVSDEDRDREPPGHHHSLLPQGPGRVPGVIVRIQDTSHLPEMRFAQGGLRNVFQFGHIVPGRFRA